MNANNEKNTLVWDKAANTLRMDTYNDESAQFVFFKTCLNSLLDCLKESKEAASGNQIMSALANYDDVKGNVRLIDFIVKMDDTHIGQAVCSDAFNLAGNLNWFRSRGFGINGFLISDGHAVITLLKDSKSSSLGARVIKGFCELMAA